MINTALELSPHDEKVEKIVRQTFVQIEKNFFRKMIEQGQTSGEISRSVVPSTTARALLSLFIGLRVLSRSRREKALLQSITNQVEALLPPVDHATLPDPISVKRHGRKVHANVTYVG